MKKNSRKKNGKIRIIGGQWRSQKLSVLNTPGLHPTTDRMRETLFNWLAPSIVNTRNLDCFAGSGALGLEALSRYASHITLLEIDSSVTRQLRKNLLKLKANNATVIRTNTLSFLAKQGTPYDIAFVDPPFQKGLLKDTLSLLEKNQWLTPEALIYVESEANSSLLKVPKNWILCRERRTEKVSYRLYLRKG